MNYEKAYKEALERARKLCTYPTTNFQSDLEDIFPELKESEDERIKNKLIKLIKMSSEVGGFALHKWEADEMIAWLEKQGEQKQVFDFKAADFKASDWYVSEVDHKIHNIHQQGKNVLKAIKEEKVDNTNKVEPKFKVGDWITDGYVGGQITNIEDNYPCYKIADFMGGINTSIPFTLQDNYHIWTIQDAKDGDVLINGSNIFIFHFLNDTRLMGYCHINTDDGRFYDDLGKNECFCLIDAVVTPATKEQRDLLFQKMREAGYKWDDEKKELKKIEHKLAEGTDEDERIRRRIIHALHGDVLTIEETNTALAWLEKQS